MTIGLIWAQGRNGVIGADGGLPWHLPEDLAHFRRVTIGQPVIMGRGTWESLPDAYRPLPGRRNIVVTTTATDLPGAEVVPTVADAMALVADEDAWVIGGSQLFDAIAPLADHAVVTEIDLEPEGDVFAPELGAGWERRGACDWNTSDSGLCYRYVTYVKP